MKLTCLGNVEETLVPVPGSRVESFMSLQDAKDRCLSHRLGSDLRGTLKSGSVEGPSSLDHQPSGDVGCISCSQEFPSRSQGPPCTRPLRQHIGGLLHKSPGGFAVTFNLQTGMPNRPVVPKEVVVSSSSLHPGVHNIGADILSRQGLRPREWRLHPEVVELIWREFGQAQVDLVASRETSHCPLWFSLMHPAPLELDVMVQRWSRFRIYAFPLITLLLEIVCRDRVILLLIAPRWPGRVQFPDIISLLDRASSGDPRQEGPSVPSRGLGISTPTRTMETVVLASEGAQLIDSGLSTEVVETFRHSRAPSTRKLYTLEWRVFTSWCSEHHLDPVNCPVGTVLEFLQERFTAGLAPSTLKVYVAVIKAHHIPLGGMSLGKDPLVSRFLRGTLRQRPAARTWVPTWVLAIVL